MSKKRVLSCIQPTGEIHIGNYFGAVRNWVNIQDQYDCIYGVVDLHAMTMPYSSKDLRQNTLNMFADLIAAGLDPERSVLFVQSLVPQHTELTWIFSCMTSFGELSRMTQFKDKSDQLEASGKNGFLSAALFTYPVLMAADILIYKADFVPVGKDQEQHLELSRNVAIRFNNQFGDYFPEPRPLYTEVQKLMSLADPEKKMSKSLGDKHYIGLFEPEESIRRKVKSAVTDVGGQAGEKMSPGVMNLFAIIKACGKMNEYKVLMDSFDKGELKYKDLKEVTADALVDLTAPFRKRREELKKDPEGIKRLAVQSSERARDLAEKTLNDVRDLTGLVRY